jgi:hypothetical protein
MKWQNYIDADQAEAKAMMEVAKLAIAVGADCSMWSSTFMVHVTYFRQS